jgi:hypothetical protein
VYERDKQKDDCWTLAKDNSKTKETNKREIDTKWTIRKRDDKFEDVDVENKKKAKGKKNWKQSYKRNFV